MYMVYYLIFNLVFVCLVLFIYLLTNDMRKTHARHLMKITKKFKILLDNCSEENDYRVPSRKIKSLKRTINLESFFAALKRMDKDKQTHIIFNNKESIIRLVQNENNKTIHAYFAYMLKDVDLFEQRGGGYGPLMLQFLFENSIYARENALKAIYSFGDEKLVADAFRKLSSQGIPHNEKLVSDGLLMFKGDVPALAKLLMVQYDSLLECYKNSLINYLNYKTIDDYDGRLIEDVSRDDISVDTACCIIRKLNKKKSERNLSILLELIRRFKEGGDWEPVSIAVKGLGYYDDNDEVKDLLKKAVVSRNWYIRKNAAESLAQIGITDEDLNEIYSQNDKYVNDAINYAVGRM